MGLYIHIPFCRSLCPFCPYTKILYEPEIAKRYTRCLESETTTVLSFLGGARVSSVYFGGGTPLTTPEALKTVISLVRPILVTDGHIALEVHPNDIDPLSADRLADYGVNMVSLGAESLDDTILKALGRSHSSEDAIEALDTLMDSQRFFVNVDLITAIPGQSLESAVSDMRRLVGRGAHQISAYPLMDFSFTSMRSQTSLRDQRRLLEALDSVGSGAGYARSSVWTWTRPGAPKYTSITRENYVGIGAGAASYAGSRFWLNTFDVGAYVDSVTYGKSPIALNIPLTDGESALYWLFWRCYEGEFSLEAKEALALPLLPILVRLAEQMGLVRRESSVVRLTDAGFFFYHILERYYTREYIGRLWRSCRESAFPGETVL